MRTRLLGRAMAPVVARVVPGNDDFGEIHVCATLANTNRPRAAAFLEGQR